MSDPLEHLSEYHKRAVEAAWLDLLPRFQENDGFMPPIVEWLPQALDAARPHLIAEVVEALRGAPHLQITTDGGFRLWSRDEYADFIEQRFSPTPTGSGE